MNRDGEHLPGCAGIQAYGGLKKKGDGGTGESRVSPLNNEVVSDCGHWGGLIPWGRSQGSS